MKYLLIIIAGVVLLCGMAMIDSNKPQKPQTADEKAYVDYAGAVSACKNWTETHSKFAVDEFVNEYELKGKKVVPGHEAVGLDYRTKGPGLLMHSRCEYAMSGKNGMLIKAESFLAK